MKIANLSTLIFITGFSIQASANLAFLKPSLMAPIIFGSAGICLFSPLPAGAVSSEATTGQRLNLRVIARDAKLAVEHSAMRFSIPPMLLSQAKLYKQRLNMGGKLIKYTAKSRRINFGEHRGGRQVLTEVDRRMFGRPTGESLYIGVSSEIGLKGLVKGEYNVEIFTLEIRNNEYVTAAQVFQGSERVASAVGFGMSFDKLFQTLWTVTTEQGALHSTLMPEALESLPGNEFHGKNTRN